MLTNNTVLRYWSLAVLTMLSTSQPAIAENDIKKASAYRLQYEQNAAGDQRTIYLLRHDIERQIEAPNASEGVGLSRQAPDSGYQMLAAFSTDSPMYGKLMKQPFHREIEHASHAVSLDPALVHAVIYVESRYQASAISPKGAIGLMQVMPATAARYGIEDVGQSPKVNIKAGTKYLEFLMRKFDNRLDLVLAAYNAGEGAVMKYDNQIPPYRETQHYVVSVMTKYHEWHQIARKKRLTHESVVTEKVPKQPIRKDYLEGTRHNLIKADLKTRH